MLSPTHLTRLLVREGGVADVGDGKGVTRWGQTPEWLQAFGLQAPASATEAKQNYERWAAKTNLERVCQDGDALAEHLLDFAVHSGEGTAIRALQRIVGVAADGALGPQTLRALALCDRSHVAHKLFAYRLRLAGKLLAREENRRYAAGWLARLADLAELL